MYDTIQKVGVPTQIIGGSSMYIEWLKGLTWSLNTGTNFGGPGGIPVIIKVIGYVVY